MSTPDDPAEPQDVLSSLPRSRRQRPSARREAARAGRAAPRKAAANKPVAASRAKTPAKRKTAAKPKVAAKPAAARRKPTGRSVIPPAGYATPRESAGHGSADPGAAIAGLVRAIVRRLPF